MKILLELVGVVLLYIFILGFFYSLFAINERED